MAVIDSTGSRRSAPERMGGRHREPSNRDAGLDAELGGLLIDLMEAMKAEFLATITDEGLTLPLGLALWHLDQPRSMRELAEELAYDASHITAIVDRLEERGLVERRMDSQDRRVKRIALTRSGRAVHNRLARKLIRDLPILGRLSVPQRRQLRDLLAIATQKR
ncbi:MAG: MarR family transcriptional regulator [Acidimicrobiales bacterium]|nr:MarR family transcriptional regulator [Acidimicrobiales bacterium]